MHLLVRCKGPFVKAQSIPLSSLFNNEISPSYDISFPYTRGEFMLVGSCKGVVCLSFDDGSVILWNPCTGESEILCNSRRSRSYGVLGFAYIHSTDRFLVVCLSTSLNELSGYLTRTEVCSSKALGWRRISDFPFGTPFFRYGQFASGSLFWLASREPAFNLGILFNNDFPWALVSFDVEKETYLEIVPPKFVGNQLDLTLGVLKDSLSLLCSYENHGDFWVFSSVGSSWTKLLTIPYTDGYTDAPYSSPLCMSANGDVFLEYDSQILRYAPKDKKTQVVQIDKFGGCMEAAVYIESLVSPKSDDLKVEAKRIMFTEEQQVDGGIYGGAEKHGEIKHGDRAQMNEQVLKPKKHTDGGAENGKKTAEGEIKHGDGAQMNGTNGEDKLGCL